MMEISYGFSLMCVVMCKILNVEKIQKSCWCETLRPCTDCTSLYGPCKDIVERSEKKKKFELRLTDESMDRRPSCERASEKGGRELTWWEVIRTVVDSTDRRRVRRPHHHNWKEFGPRLPIRKVVRPMRSPTSRRPTRRRWASGSFWDCLTRLI